MDDERAFCGIIVDELPHPSSKFDESANVREAVQLPLGEVKMLDNARLLLRVATDPC